jgi:hypothetical protein
MKCRYKLLLGLLCFAGLVALWSVSMTGVGDHPRLENAVQLVAVFAAVAAAIVALSATDPKRESVKVRLVHSLSTDHIETYAKDDLPRGLRDAYDDLPHLFASARVEFRMTNLSGFTLNRPTFTFMLPKDRAHPVSRSFASPGPTANAAALNGERGPMIRGNRVFSVNYNSNLFNPEQPPSRLEFADTYVLSNCVLPFWNRDQQVTVWIRMIVDDGTRQPFPVRVSVNCDNADGWTKEVMIEQKPLVAGVPA